MKSRKNNPDLDSVNLAGVPLLPGLQWSSHPPLCLPTALRRLHTAPRTTQGSRCFTRHQHPALPGQPLRRTAAWTHVCHMQL